MNGAADGSCGPEKVKVLREPQHRIARPRQGNPRRVGEHDRAAGRGKIDQPRGDDRRRRGPVREIDAAEVLVVAVAAGRAVIEQLDLGMRRGALEHGLVLLDVGRDQAQLVPHDLRRVVDAGEPGDLVVADAGQVRRRQDVQGVVIHLHGDHVLPQRAAALHPAGRLAGRLHRRQQQRDQDADDGDDDQQFDQRETEAGNANVRNSERPCHNQLLVVKAGTARPPKAAGRCAEQCAAEMPPLVDRARACAKRDYRGRSSGSRIDLLAAPSRENRSAIITVAVRRSSPVTAAGPQRICTVFPILSGRPQAAGTPRVRGGNVSQSRGASSSRANQTGTN